MSDVNSSLADRIERFGRALRASELAELLAVSHITIFKHAKARVASVFQLAALSLRSESCGGLAAHDVTNLNKGERAGFRLDKVMHLAPRYHCAAARLPHGQMDQPTQPWQPRDLLAERDPELDSVLTAWDAAWLPLATPNQGRLPPFSTTCAPGPVALDSRHCCVTCQHELASPRWQ